MYVVQTQIALIAAVLTPALCFKLALVLQINIVY